MRVILTLVPVNSAQIACFFVVDIRFGAVNAYSSVLEVRTKAFAIRVIRMYAALPKTEVARVLGKQVLRSGTSVG